MDKHQINMERTHTVTVCVHMRVCVYMCVFGLTLLYWCLVVQLTLRHRFRGLTAVI